MHHQSYVCFLLFFGGRLSDLIVRFRKTFTIGDACGIKRSSSEFDDSNDGAGSNDVWDESLPSEFAESVSRECRASSGASDETFAAPAVEVSGELSMMMCPEAVFFCSTIGDDAGVLSDETFALESGVEFRESSSSEVELESELDSSEDRASSSSVSKSLAAFRLLRLSVMR